MKRNILCTLAVMAACAILVACGKTDDQISPITPESNAASSEAEATPEPTPTLPPYEANVLTGEAKGENYPEGQRNTALMVNNLVDARPQRGLSKAQMLFEIKVEGGITRFMPVFNDYHDIDEIGPIRSGRDQFFQLILPWQALYIHEGQSVVMQQYALDYDYGLLNNNDGASGYRDYNRVNWRGLSYGNGLALEHTMKDGVILVNTSRGALVKTDDLIEGIRAHKFFGVGLDVYEEETPNVFEDRSDEILEHSVTARLLSFPNVMITSHQGFFTHEALSAIAQTTLENVRVFEKNGESPNEVK